MRGPHRRLLAVARNLARPAASSFVATAWRNRELLRLLTYQDAMARYRTSILGVSWAITTPLLMLAVYAIAFSAVLGIDSWVQSDGQSVPFVMAIFAGMIVFNFFGEVFSRSPTVIVAQPSLVKRVIFPVELLPIVAVCSAAVHACIAGVALLFGQMLLGDGIHPTLLYLPLVLVPLFLFSMMTAWLLASIGVYVRDVAAGIAVATQVLFFMTPVIYPSSRVPEGSVLDVALAANPMAAVIESVRNITLSGSGPEWSTLLAWTLILLPGTILAWRWFHLTKPGFADVL